MSFARIQFTPDLLPADVTGIDIFNEQSRELEFPKDRCSGTSCWPTR